MVEPLYHWANETTDRVPLTDWFDSVDGQQEEFRARSVVGGLFIKALAEAFAASDGALPEASLPQGPQKDAQIPVE
jgi:hypothetical protein